jgi:hypothetical protein
MADQRAPQEPKPPAGLHGPAAEGAENVLDPAVRGELRALIREAVWSAFGAIAADLFQRGAAGPQAPAQPPAGAPAAPAPPAPAPPAGQPAAGPGGRQGTEAAGRFPFPHGDLDLRGIPANVPAAEERRPRRGAARRFYFLPAEQEAPADEPPAPPAKPG